MAYSDKNNVNTLTALLVAHGVQNAVCCPGSRNAAIVHNLNECPDIECYPVTDERSAGFYALGMAQSLGEPVAVCVTSGTALLNLVPAVAEAFYQHVPLVVISADRPSQWIDQLDGQTLPQTDALGRFVRKAVTLPEPLDSEQRWWCNRLMNEALLAARAHGGGPVHINVPLSEPLYGFTEKSLPEERTIVMAHLRNDKRQMGDCLSGILHAKRPLIVVGQVAEGKLMADDFRFISGFAVVLNEALSVGRGACHFDELLSRENLPADLTPDFVLYLGDVLVSKRLKAFLRRLPDDVPVWAVSEDGSVHDTFMRLTGVIEGHPADVLADIGEAIGKKGRHTSSTSAYFDLWDGMLAEVDKQVAAFSPDYSQMAAVKELESQFDRQCVTHYANSMSVRLGNIYAQHYVWCNRGVNGIEGSLSTAAGFSLATTDDVFCILGDLSFFYDSNALWQDDLGDNLRILLLNNGGGGIFEKFKGLEGSAARERFVMAKHHATAAGICQSYGVHYCAAHDMKEMKEGIDWLVNGMVDVERPLLLEVFTDSAEDMRVLKEYFAGFAFN